MAESDASESSQSGVPTPFELRGQKQIDEVKQYKKNVKALVDFGIPEACFEDHNCLMEGVLPTHRAKLVKVFQPFIDKDQLEEVYTIGLINKVVGAKSKLKTAQFFKFCNWLKSPDGAKAIREHQLREKLQEKGKGDFTAYQVGNLAIYDTMRAELAAKEKRIRSKKEAQILALQEQIAALRDEEDAELAKAREEFDPVPKITFPDTMEFNKACWDEYARELAAKGKPVPRLTVALLTEAVNLYQDVIRQRVVLEHLEHADGIKKLHGWVERKVAHFQRKRKLKQATRFVAYWHPLACRTMMAHPLKKRMKMLDLIPVGTVQLSRRIRYCVPLSQVLLDASLRRKRQKGTRNTPLIPRSAEINALAPGLLETNPRLSVHRELGVNEKRAIPFSRSKFETGVRRIIGGGEMRDWHIDGNMYRGGGCFSDAIRLLADADPSPPGRLLRDRFTVARARTFLCLPSRLNVPRDVSCCKLKNFNDEATAGPFFRAFDVKTKCGMRDILPPFVWHLFDDYACGVIDAGSLPYFCGRVGFRSKLVTTDSAIQKLAAGKPIGRCVVMMDAIEQAACSPLYNVLSKQVEDHLGIRLSGFRNTVVRASSDWCKFYEEVKEAKVVIELDWKKFDRERPSEDIDFCIDVILSCFSPKDEYEAKLLEAYGIVLRRALIDRVLITDTGGVFSIDGMVPSGSLWTGFLDTMLNILYVTDVVREIGCGAGFAVPKCCGDDNLTLFYRDPGDDLLKSMRKLLNEFYRAGIDEEDFIIHRPPYFVTKEQAIFPPGTDLSKGTSELLDDATWVEFVGEIRVDEAAGRSHRWRYNFYGKPKFLSCYWLPSGLPIRPAKDNLEKLLYPEGIHESLEDYEAAVLAMVVDNPFNHHNINHLKHRYIICRQLSRYSLIPVKIDIIMQFAEFRSIDNDPVPFPDVAQWRRQPEYVDLDRFPPVADHAKRFDEFVAGVSTLYERRSEGGLDAYKFMQLIRGESAVGSNQWGNDIYRWLRFMHNNPATRYLKETRRFRNLAQKKSPAMPDREKVVNALLVLDTSLREGQFRNTLEYALWISHMLRPD
ncbi:TPA_asm: fusion protein [Amaranthus tuberculatus amalgavirus 2]|nr:TPA_asm: fusion protein [Amaranthus tuberculatus amalgavirus 2]